MEILLVLLPLLLIVGPHWVRLYIERTHIKSFVEQKGWRVLHISLTLSWSLRYAFNLHNHYNVIYKDNLGKQKKAKCVSSIFGLLEWDA